MGTLPTLITDLALILVLAGIVSLIFRRLKQPLVLGYIVAGFICGPQVSFFPSVVDAANVSTWADIGVIFLMFTLGLEFSFKKIFKMGSAPFIAACTIIFCMIGLGSVAGHFFGWSDINSLFLGGMLAMSSTTVIYKALNDMGHLADGIAVNNCRKLKFPGHETCGKPLATGSGTCRMVCRRCVYDSLFPAAGAQMDVQGDIAYHGFGIVLPHGSPR